MPTAPDSTPCTTERLPFVPQSAATARDRMRRELRAAGVRDSVVDDAELVVTELLSNALRHGRPLAGDDVEVTWCLDSGSLLVSVCDGGGSSSSTIAPVDLTDHALSGRGLAIVDAVCRRWRVATDGETRITAELDFA